MNALSVYAPSGRGPTVNAPLESATATYTTLSGRETASTHACGAGRSAIQSKTRPRSANGGTAAPVDNTTVRLDLLAFPRRSAAPGSSVTVYAVFARHPERGRT